MIVECEKCGSTFNLDDTLIQDKGSKVRCSVCKHTFTVLPSQEDDEIEPLLELTESLDSLPADDEEEDTKPEPDDIFDKAFEEALNEDIEEEAVEEEAAPVEAPVAGGVPLAGPALLLLSGTLAAAGGLGTYVWSRRK